MVPFYFKKSKKFKKICVLIICVSIFIMMMPERIVGEDISLHAMSAVLMDGDLGRVLYDKNGENPMANASTTKILTGIIVLENCDRNEMVIVSKNAASQPNVQMDIVEGEEYLVEELLYGMMLESYNDCAVALAEHVSGSVEDFSVLMNEKAKEIGCTDTYFITPNGLDAENENGIHHTTATDLCKIMRYCVWESPKAEEYVQITSTENYKNCVNRNLFLGMEEDAITGKTGYTSKAGYCYVAAIEKNGKKMCIALLGCGWPSNKNYKWEDTKNLITYCDTCYRFVSINDVIESLEQKKTINVLGGYNENPSLESWQKICTIQISPKLFSDEEKILVCDNESFDVRYEFNKKWEAPVLDESEIGSMKIFLNGEEIKNINLYADNEIEKWDYVNLFKCILDEFLLRKVS